MMKLNEKKRKKSLNLSTCAFMLNMHMNSTNVSLQFTLNRWYWSTAMSALLKSKILPVVIQNKCDNARVKIIIYPLCTQSTYKFAFQNSSFTWCSWKSIPYTSSLVSFIHSPLKLQHKISYDYYATLQNPKIKQWLYVVPGKPKKQFQK